MAGWGRKSRLPTQGLSWEVREGGRRYPRPGWKNDQVNCQVLADSSPNRPAYRCRRRCLLPTRRNHLHDALQSHRLPFWFGLVGSISDTVRCRRGQLYLGIPDTYPCRAARLSRWSGVHKQKQPPGGSCLCLGNKKTASVGGLMLLEECLCCFKLCIGFITFLNA